MRDITYRQAMYENWKENVVKFEGDKRIILGIEGVNKRNSELIINYILDIEEGKNTGGSKRGNRSYSRLNASKHLLIQLSGFLEKRGFNDMTKITSNNLIDLINDLKKGKIQKIKGGKYSEVTISDYVKIYKAFFNWFRRIEKREKGIILEDITEDLSGNYTKTRFCYITKEQKDKMLEYLSPDEQLFANFLWDSLIRSPKEVFNLKAKDVYEKDGEAWVNIPEEISKTFGRQFNLLYCGEDILKYIKEKELEADDYLFNLNYKEFNRKIKEIAVKLFGDIISHPKAEKRFSELSGYDFRHGGSISLRQIAQKNNSISLDTIRQRAGWKDFDMLNYYTQFLGLTGEINKEALMVTEDKTKLQKEVQELRKQNKELAGGLVDLANQINEISQQIKKP